jgi:hypothetical protein
MRHTRTVRELLADYTVLLNRNGVDSAEAKAFIEAHQKNRRFVQLAELSRVLKKALTAPPQDCAPHPDHLL